MSRASALLPLLASFAFAQIAGAQGTDETVFGAHDTIFGDYTRTPVTYTTSYDRDVSSGTWFQSLAYSITRGKIAFSTSGSYTAIDYLSTKGAGAGSGGFDGKLSYQARPNWFFDLQGDFNKVSTRDIVSESSQRKNRLRVATQYNLRPIRNVELRTIGATEFQQDHTLTLRPLGRETLRIFPRYNAAGDSVGVDSIFVKDQRDSTYTSGRQDGLMSQLEWKIRPRLIFDITATGNRAHPTLRSITRDFGRHAALGPTEHVDRDTTESPSDNVRYETKLTHTAASGVSKTLTLIRTRTNQSYYEQLLRDQERLVFDQSRAALHVEQRPFFGAQITVDGLLDRSKSEYKLKKSRTSLVSTQLVKGNFFYNPNLDLMAGMEFSFDHHRNELQAAGNGENQSRFIQGNVTRKITRRLALSAVATASLTRFEYVDSVLDQDNARSYVNVGGGYQVSPRCSTTVHFSASRGHLVAIDPTRAGSNNVQSTYQMDATLRLAASRRLYISQNYVLNAVYQIYDAAAARSKDVLSRIRRIDTTISDSIFSYAAVQLIHNFLFYDSGSYTEPPGGGGRKYRVGSETYQQSLSAGVSVFPLTGVRMFALQSLGNSRTYFRATGEQFVSNRWNLTLGSDVDRPIFEGASLKGAVQYISAYTERTRPDEPLNEQKDWIAGVTLTKEF